MLKKLTLMSVVAVLCLFVTGQPSTLKPIFFGDRMPALKIKNIMNSASPIIDLKEFKGKTLIIHFLVTTCPSSVASAKKYDSLLKASGGELKVLIVTFWRLAQWRISEYKPAKTPEKLLRGRMFN